MNFRISRIWLLAIVGLLLLAGCGSDNNETNTAGSDPRITEGGTNTIFARFDAAVLPLPNDVTWAADGNPAVDLPASAADSVEMAQLKALVNAQGILGLSPNMFLTLPLTGTVDSSTLALRVFRIDDASLLNDLFVAGQTNPAGVPAALAALDYRTQANFVVEDDFASGVVKLLPKTPFVPGAGYAVVVGPGLVDSNGYPVASSFTMQALKSQTPFAADSPYAKFENLRAAFNDGASALFNVVGGLTNITSGGTAPWSRDDVAVMWTFHTAPTTLSLTPTAAAPDNTLAYPTDVDPFSATTAGLKAASSLVFTANNLQWLDLSTGSPVVSATPVGLPASAVLTPRGIPATGVGNVYFGFYQSPTLASNFTETDSVYFLIALPEGVAPTGGFPMVLFQHGITSSKEVSLAMASSLAQAGIGVIAIDAPYHGARTPAGAESGDGFFTSNLLADRANIYQAAIDLWEMVDIIDEGIDIDVATNPGNDLNPEQLDFVAHSLGSIIGSAFLSQETRVERMILSSPSAMLVNVLDDTSLPTMQALVASLGYTPGTTSYYVFLNLAQWLLDPADAAYMGIGTNLTGNLMTLYAYGDPIVSPDSTKVFLTNLGLDLAATVTVDPELGPAIPADIAGGAYQYGLAGKPIVHSFLLSPLFDLVEEPWYTGYDSTVQVGATTGAQTQVAYYLAP
jgi:hypothetical protein